MASDHVVVSETLGDLIVSGKCPITGQVWFLTVPRVGYEEWCSGKLIQKALPGLSNDQRELLITGMTPEGWKQTFGEEE